MPYDSKLADRVRGVLEAKSARFEAKAMMGGLCFMVNGKMCVGVEKDRLMIRLDPDTQSDALAQPGCTPMDFTGRPMRGFVFVDRAAVTTELTLCAWIERALEFNPRAKSSKSKKKTPKKNRSRNRPG